MHFHDPVSGNRNIDLLMKSALYLDRVEFLKIQLCVHNVSLESWTTFGHGEGL